MNQVQDQLERIRRAAREYGDEVTYQQAWEQAVRDVATANKVDPDQAVAGNPWFSSMLPENQDFSTPGGVVGAQNLLNQYLAGLQSQFNRVNEVGPYGQSSYVQNPDGTFTRRFDLSPNQALLNAFREEQDIRSAGLRKALMGDVEGQFGQPVDFGAQFGQAPSLDFGGASPGGNLSFRFAPGLDELSFEGLQALPGTGFEGSSDIVGERQRIEDKLFDRYKQRLAPDHQRERQELEQRLADQGIALNSELYNDSINRLERQQNDELLDLSTKATEFGGGEFSRLYGIGADIRRQGVNEAQRLFDAQQRRRQQAVGENISLFEADESKRRRETGEAKDLFDAQGRERDRAIGEFFSQRYAPLQEANMLSQQMRGVMQPSFAPMAQIGIPGIDVIGAGLGFGNLANQMAIAQLQAETAGADRQSRFDLANLQAGEAWRRLMAQQDFAQNQIGQSQPIAAPPRPSGGGGKGGFGGTAGAAAGAFAGPFLGGLGQAAGEGLYPKIF